MQSTNDPNAECPAARALDCVGEWWSILILRDAFQGFTRFEEFRESLGIAPNMLSRRLAHLTDAGLFERRLYCDKPPRHEYVLTARGEDFFPVMIALFEWGNRHLTPAAKSLVLADRETGRPLRPLIVDAESFRKLTPDVVALRPGPAASAAMRARLASTRRLRPVASLHER